MINLLYPFASVLAESGGKTLDKLNFQKNRIAAHQQMLLVFAVMSIALLAYIVFTDQVFPNLTLLAFGLVVLIAMVSFASNVFDVLSLKVNDISLREPMSDFQTILAGMIGYALFPEQRKPVFLVIFVIGVFIMFWGTHRRKLRKYQVKGMHFFLMSIIFESFLPSIYQLTLGYVSPTFIAFFRVIGILVLSLLFFPLAKTFKALTTGKLTYSAAAGIFYAGGAVISLYSIHILGVVQTMLILLIAPSLNYLIGYFILKERVRKGEVISSLALVSLVLVSVII